MATSIYDPDLWDRLVPANVLGGRNRAIKARRDKWGRLLPNDHDLPAPACHGKAGGDAVLRKYGREYFKELRKKRGLKP